MPAQSWHGPQQMHPVAGEDGSVSTVPLTAPLVLDRQVNLSERIADALRAALVAGHMRPGVVYSVPTLAEQFGVSATPVREAMLDLAKAGLVQPVRNKGFRVVELTEKDLDDITALRALIEVPTVARLAEVADTNALHGLRPLAEDICVNAEQGNLLGYLEADRRFHLTLLSLANNARLVDVVSDLRAQTRLYGLDRLLEEHRLTASAREHASLLEALLRRDAAEAEQLMRRHIGHVRGIWASAEED